MKALWILLALLSSLHFQPNLWLKGERLSLANNFTLFWKYNFALSIFFSSWFLSRIRLENFLFINLTIVVFGVPLPILWHHSISLFSTVKLIDLHIWSTSCWRWSSNTGAEIPWISMLFTLGYWSSLFLEISSSINFSLRESTLDSNFKFSAFKASMIESFTLIKLSVTMTLMLALIFSSDSPRSLYKLSNFSF